MWGQREISDYMYPSHMFWICNDKDTPGLCLFLSPLQGAVALILVCFSFPPNLVFSLLSSIIKFSVLNNVYCIVGASHFQCQKQASCGLCCAWSSCLSGDTSRTPALQWKVHKYCQRETFSCRCPLGETLTHRLHMILSLTAAARILFVAVGAVD
jgi:hypothetical protein